MADEGRLEGQRVDTGAWLRHMSQSVAFPTGKLHLGGNLGWKVGKASTPLPQGTPYTQLHLALPAPGVAGVAVPHPHAAEGVIGDFPLVPDAEQQQGRSWVRLGWGSEPHPGACSSLFPNQLTRGSRCRHSSGRSARAGSRCGMGRTRTCTWGCSCCQGCSQPPPPPPRPALTWTPPG